MCLSEEEVENGSGKRPLQASLWTRFNLKGTYNSLNVKISIQKRHLSQNKKTRRTYTECPLCVNHNDNFAALHDFEGTGEFLTLSSLPIEKKCLVIHM